MCISEDRIIFRSEYAPTIIAELSRDEIERLKNDRRIEGIEYYFPFESVGDDATDSVIALERDVSNIVEVNDSLGLTGEGVKIGMFESSHPNELHDSIDSANIINRSSDNIGQHATDVARIMVGDSYDTNSKKIELGDVPVGFSLFSWEGMSLNQNYGAFRFYTRTGADVWYIGCDDENAFLSNNNSSLLSSYWILEKQNYRLGDVDLDGTIDSNDKMLVQSYLANLVSLDNKQMFLADVDSDGLITTLDALQIELIYS